MRLGLAPVRRCGEAAAARHRRGAVERRATPAPSQSCAFPTLSLCVSALLLVCPHRSPPPPAPLPSSTDDLGRQCVGHSRAPLWGHLPLAPLPSPASPKGHAPRRRSDHGQADGVWLPRWSAALAARVGGANLDVGRSSYRGDGPLRHAELSAPPPPLTLQPLLHQLLFPSLSLTPAVSFSFPLGPR